jgi:hypothetical protein
MLDNAMMRIRIRRIRIISPDPEHSSQRRLITRTSLDWIYLLFLTPYKYDLRL